MVKSTRIELKPDDPIFTRGPQVFKPVARPVQKEELRVDSNDNDIAISEIEKNEIKSKK